MKKNILFAIVALFSMVLLNSCSKDTEGETRITYYPTLELIGPSTVIVEKNSTYTDLGCKATLDGQDVSNQLTVSNDVNTAKSGAYAVTYSFTNADGFKKQVTRSVFVFDSNDPMEGIFIVSPSSYRDRDGAITPYGSAFETYVFNNGNGAFTFTDLLGGYYDQRAGYGARYQLNGLLINNGDGTLTYYESYLEGWGDSADDVEATFDVDTKTYSLVTDYAGMKFYITMTKK